MSIHFEYWDNPDPDEPPKKVWLLRNQSVVVGRSSSNDVAISSDPQMADRHFEITDDGKEWRVRPGTAMIRVDGLHCSSGFAKLSTGSVIEAGRTRFRVVSIARELEQRTQEAPPELPPVIVQRSADLKLTAVWEPDQIPNLMEKIFTGMYCYALVNYKFLAGRIEEIPLCGEDLFEHAPDEVRKENSLGLVEISEDIFYQDAVSFLEASRQDGLIFLVSELNSDQLKQQMSILWAWYRRPSVLDFHLLNGTEFLTEKLLEPVYCVCILDPQDDRQLHCFANSRSMNELELKMAF
ncbi:MAG: FHA domain-containing protein [Planctomycetales bacterium]|nr:FHA domain-containing protein [Planctomycetales bacterium]